jgi:ADP-ribose pyrophosphatase
MDGNVEGKKWKLLKTETVFESKYLTVEKRAYELPDGRVVNDYFHLSRPDYVLVLAINEIGEILVEKQYRRGVDEFVLEIPAGWINKDEKPIDAAVRELKEETGAMGVEEEVREIFAQPGFSSIKAYVAVLKVNGKLGDHSRDADEHILFEWMTRQQINEKIKKGDIKDMGFLAALAVLDEGGNF